MSSEAVEVTAEVIEEPTSELSVTYTPAVIDDNLAAVEAWVKSQVAPYRGAVIDYDDDERRKEARKARSDLNKMKDPIKADLKRIKDAYMAPMNAFEGRVKGIIGIIDDAREDIDAQFKAGEKAFKDGRRAALQKEYEAVAGPVAGLIPLESFVESEWLAPKRSEEWACGKLADKAAEALDAYNQIMKLDLPFKDEAVARFCQTLSFVEAIKRNSELEEGRRRMEEFRTAQAAVEAQAPKPEPRPEPKPAARPVAAPAPRHAPEPAADPVCRWSLSTQFEGTRALAQQVAAALKGLGITGAAIKFEGEVRRG